MTVDEELERLEHDLRRLKIEYEIYLNGNAKQPPQETAFRVQTAIKRFSSEGARLSFRQRFKFNQLVQRHAVQSGLWRRRLKDKEEGRTSAAPPKVEAVRAARPASFETEVSDPQAESDKVERFVMAMIAARRQTGEPELPDPKAMSEFVRQSVEDLKQAGCGKVRLSLGIENGKVRFQVLKGS